MKFSARCFDCPSRYDGDYPTNKESDVESILQTFADNHVAESPGHRVSLVRNGACWRCGEPRMFSCACVKAPDSG